MHNKLLIVGLGLFIGIVVLSITLLSIGVGTYNQASRLKNTYDSKIASNRAELDNVKKKISQVAQVSNAQMKSLEEIYNGYAKSRTPEGSGRLMSWIKEAIPNVDQSTFKNLQNIITGSRDAWTMRQTELVDISREYNQMLVTFPSNVFLKMFGFEKINPKVITSDSTEKSFETGKDNETKVF